MSLILDRARAHYAAIDRRRLEVPEWGEPGRPLVVTWSALTMADRRRIYRRGEDGSTPDAASTSVRTLIHKACDEAGKPLFDGMAEHALTYEVDAEIVGRIASAILYGIGMAAADTPLDDRVDDAKKG